MRGIEKRFGATVALNGVDLEVAGGEVIGLVGENGAGKSTLMKILAGALRADAGTMELGDQPYRPRDPQAARRAGVAMIYQELSLAPHLEVAENILLGVEPARWGLVRRRAARATARDALAQLGHPDISPRARVSTLSVAQQQMVEIARAVAIGCRVLVLDEPTSSLTRADVEKLFALIRRLKTQGHAIVYISHFLEEVSEITDRVTVLRDGQSVGGGATADLATTEIIRLMVGRQVADLYPRSPRAPGDAALEADGLTLRRGEVVGIAGLIGAGRTEYLRRIFARRSWPVGVGLVSEDRKTEGLALSLSLTDNTTLPSLPAWVSPRRETARTRHWLEKLSVKCRAPGQRVSHLSGGNQQKIAIARLFAADAEVWLLDEPTRGIDVGSKAEIYRLIDELARAGKAVLMVSSYLPELLGVCDRVAVMCRGRLGPARAVSDRDEHEIMQEATGG
jgi:ribose transport system ATP-binding protein